MFRPLNRRGCLVSGLCVLRPLKRFRGHACSNSTWWAAAAAAAANLRRQPLACTARACKHTVQVTANLTCRHTRAVCRALFLLTGARRAPSLRLAGKIAHNVVQHGVAGLTSGTDRIVVPCQLLEWSYTAALGRDDSPHLEGRDGVVVVVRQAAHPLQQHIVK